MECGALQLWSLIHTNTHIQMHKHAPWGAGDSVMGEKGLGEEGRMFAKGKKAEGFQQTAYCLSPDATDIIPGIFSKY